MLTLTGYSFDSVDGAQQLLDLVVELTEQQLFEVEDAALATWPERRTRPKTEHLSEMTENGALGGAFWGMLFGLIFFVPFLGMAVGAAMGALTGHYSTYGIDKGFIVRARNGITVGTSALFLLASEAVQDKVVDAAVESGLKLERFDTHLSTEQETQLHEDFGT